MSTFAVVPVKNLLKSKLRLSVLLNNTERQALTLAMLEDVLGALRFSMVCRTIVISSDSTVHRFAENFGIEALQENGQGLNQAVDQATQWCIQKGAKSVLTLPVDIPLITSDDINHIINLGHEETSIVISPSRNGGTNALLQRPPNLIPPCFGPDSFKEHLNQALTMGIQPKIYRSPRVSLDIDSERDIENFLKIGKHNTSYQLLSKLSKSTLKTAHAYSHKPSP
jgi:2-phospho-L-lactate guanylyltransferase